MSSETTSQSPALRPVVEDQTVDLIIHNLPEHLDDEKTFRAFLAARKIGYAQALPVMNWVLSGDYVSAWHPNSARPKPAEDERQEKEIERLRKEVKRLMFQNELLQTRVVEQRRSLAREARTSDKLHAELVAVRDQNAQILNMQDKYLTLLSDRGRVNDALVAKMAGVEDGLIRMHESYEGQVQHVGENTVVVLYNIDGQLVEQTYERKQFKDGKLPRPGTCVRVLVFVVEYEPKPPTANELESETSDKPSHRKPLTGPIEF
jgi:hypothetical protein